MSASTNSEPQASSTCISRSDPQKFDLDLDLDLHHSDSRNRNRNRNRSRSPNNCDKLKRLPLNSNNNKEDRPFTVSGPTVQQCEGGVVKPNLKLKPKQRHEHAARARSKKIEANNPNPAVDYDRPNTTSIVSDRHSHSHSHHHTNKSIKNYELPQVPEPPGSIGGKGECNKKVHGKVTKEQGLEKESGFTVANYCDLKCPQQPQCQCQYDNDKGEPIHRIRINNASAVSTASPLLEKLKPVEIKGIAGEKLELGKHDSKMISQINPISMPLHVNTKNGDNDNYDNPCDNDKDNSPVKQFMDSVTSLIASAGPIHEKVFGGKGNNSSVKGRFRPSHFLSSAAKIGGELYRAGVSVANIFFSEQDTIRDDTITYNGYKIHTFGTHLCINSIILRGSKGQKLRIVVQTSDYGSNHQVASGTGTGTGTGTGPGTETETGETKVNSSKNDSRNDEKQCPRKSKCQFEQRIFVSDVKWTLIYGCYEEEGTGMVEIEAPRRRGISVKDIKTEGPCNGLIFIDVP